MPDNTFKDAKQSAMRDALLTAQRIIEREFPNGQAAIDIRNALATSDIIPDVAQPEKVSRDALAIAGYLEELTLPDRLIDFLLDRKDRTIIIAALKSYAAQPPAAPGETKSAPEDSAPHNSGERLPSSDAATAGADTQCSAGSAAETASTPEYDDKCEYYPYFEMLWKWFEERRGKEDMRANAIDGLSVADFKSMLDEHEAALLNEPQPMSTREAALEAAARDFIEKVDRGHARSLKSYSAFLSALSLPRPHGGGK